MSLTLHCFRPTPSAVSLKINNRDESIGTFHPEASGRQSYQLSLDSSRLYFGGVPPDFARARWPELTFVPLLGCMEDLQVGSTAQNPLVGNSTGVARECGRQVRREMVRGLWEGGGGAVGRTRAVR